MEPREDVTGRLCSLQEWSVYPRGHSEALERNSVVKMAIRHSSQAVGFSWLMMFMGVKYLRKKEFQTYPNSSRKTNKAKKKVPLLPAHFMRTKGTSDIKKFRLISTMTVIINAKMSKNYIRKLNLAIYGIRKINTVRCP